MGVTSHEKINYNNFLRILYSWGIPPIRIKHSFRLEDDTRRASAELLPSEEDSKISVFPGHTGITSWTIIRILDSYWVSGSSQSMALVIWLDQVTHSFEQLNFNSWV